MAKKVITFDLDGTLAESKSRVTESMADVLSQLLHKFHVCVISGGKLEQFEKQFLAYLSAEAAQLEQLHLMPTCGTRYHTYDAQSGKWAQVYAEDFTDNQKRKIIDALNKGIDALGFREERLWGDLIEDRGSQITFSALGQEAPVAEKEQWDPDGTKKQQLRGYVVKLLPEFEVRSGGTTSIDVTKLGIDKAHGMRKLMEILGIDKDEILFIGDALHEGGNDYPVKAMGIDSLSVNSWRDTLLAVKAIMHVV